MPPAHRRLASDQPDQIEVGGHVLAAELVGRDGDERVGGADVDVPDPGDDVVEAEWEVEEEVEVGGALGDLDGADGGYLVAKVDLEE